VRASKGRRRARLRSGLRARAGSRPRTAVLGTFLIALAATGLVSCSGSRTHRATGPASPARVVIASFNFEESTLVAEIYAQALEQAGVPVRREFNLGPREMVLPALRQGLVDLVPEYLGSLLTALKPDENLQGATASAERGELAPLLDRWGVEVLPPSPAEDQNGLVVTEALAQRFGLHTISDLAPISPQLTMGGPTECPTRPYCLVGLGRVYGLRFSRFEAFDAESQRITALEQDVVDVALLDTTDGVLATGKFALLTDDRRLQPADNLAPVLSGRAVRVYGPRVANALGAVSAKLTTSDLTFLNWRVGVAGKDVASEARGWLQRHGLVAKA
jgi:osmoprotectant transport system substrate-binding protein